MTNHDQHAIETQSQALARQATGYQDANIVSTEPIAVFTGTPQKAMAQMTDVVSHVAQQIDNDRFISNIQGKKYPKVEWWTTVGASLGLFPVVKYSRRLDREEHIVYEARVEVMNNGRVVTSGEAICSSQERNWSSRDEYAIKSMAITRATGKAYRTGLSMIAVMAGLEGTPAEEMPDNTPAQRTSAPPQQPRSNRQPAKPTQQASDDDKPWLNDTFKGSSDFTPEWQEVMENIDNGTWKLNDIFDRYKVSRKVRAGLDKLIANAPKEAPAQQVGNKDELPEPPERVMANFGDFADEKLF